MRQSWIIPDETRAHLVKYLASLQAGIASAGKRLRDNLAGIELASLTEAGFLDALLNTKLPQIFAESAVAGDEPPPTPGLRREGSRGDEKGNS